MQGSRKAGDLEEKREIGKNTQHNNHHRNVTLLQRNTACLKCSYDDRLKNLTNMQLWTLCLGITMPVAQATGSILFKCICCHFHFRTILTLKSTDNI